MTIAITLRGALCAAALATLSVAVPPAQADDRKLRFCVSEVEPPYSARGGRGFENRLAETVARSMDREAVLVWSDKPAIYAVRDQLDRGVCDVVMGVDAGDERVLTSRPYYRTGYALVTKADRNITASRWDDPQVAALNRFAVRFHSPGELVVKQLGKYEDNVSYAYSLINFRSPRNQYVQIPAERLLSEVTKGDADAAIVFAPDVARQVKDSGGRLRMTLITNDVQGPDGGRVPLQFSQSVGVRKDDAKLLEQIEAGLDKARPEIRAILAEEGIPLLEPVS